jgi:ABC-type molybdate transport system ATPase subunit
MNQIEAVVTDIKKTDVVTYIDVKCGETGLRLIKFKAPAWLCQGDRVTCKFQEASVCVSKECPGKVSIENKLPVHLKEVRRSESLCELTFDSEMGTVVSLITEDAYNDLGLELDCDATMLVRAVDITVEPVLDFTRTKVANKKM